MHATLIGPTEECYLHKEQEHEHETVPAVVSRSILSLQFRLAGTQKILSACSVPGRWSPVTKKKNSFPEETWIELAREA